MMQGLCRSAVKSIRFFLLFLFFWFFGSCSLNPLHLCPVILRRGFGLLLRYYANIMQKRPGDIIN